LDDLRIEALQTLSFARRQTLRGERFALHFEPHGAISEVCRLVMAQRSAPIFDDGRARFGAANNERAVDGAPVWQRLRAVEIWT
jgi:hypothetical protein